MEFQFVKNNKKPFILTNALNSDFTILLTHNFSFFKIHIKQLNIGKKKIR